ncbi:MAG: F0F1 ATP synthase subunit epsilon [Actinomycetota bacterium]|nr:F0F1 ATP synthase subunit epsilon [Actinomycetota bacterium]
MPDGAFEVSVVTPEAQLLRTQARAIVLRSSDGDLTVLDGHTPIITDVLPGDVRVDPAEGDPVHLAVHGGYLQVETGQGIDGAEGRATRVTLLAGTAELAAQIDVPRAERARAEAEARVEELRQAAGRAGGPGTGAAAGGGAHAGGEGEGALPEDVELAEAEAALERARVRLEVAGVTA